MNQGNSSCLPVVLRELRVQARKPSNRWLRFLAAAMALALYAILSLYGGYNGRDLGQALFHSLNTIILAMIVLLAPLLTADCISIERREGTLGLLFLTPLTPWQIVLGKSLIHGIRSASIFLAIAPLLMVPLLLGGVSGKEFILAALIDSTTLCLGLAAGIIASSFCRKLTWALTTAELLGFSFALFFFIVNASTAGVISAGINGIFIDLHAVLKQIIESFHYRPLADFLFGSFAFNAGLEFDYRSTGWGRFFASTSTLQQAWWIGSAVVFLAFAVLFLAYAMSNAARRMKKALRELPPSPGTVKLYKTFCTPIFWKKTFRKEMKRLLERNPIGWVHRNSWSARIGGFLWCLIFVFLETLFISGDFTLRNLHFGQALLVHVLLLGLAFSAAGSFQHERDSGLMELILITPLSVSQIINGRLRALWGQYFPSAFILLLVAIFIHENQGLFSEINFYFRDYFDSRIRHSAFLFLIGSYILIPIAGLYFSQMRLHFIGAWAATLFFGFALPLFAGAILTRTTYYGFVWLPLMQLTLAGLFWQLLHQNLAHRIFSHAQERSRIRAILNLHSLVMVASASLLLILAWFAGNLLGAAWHPHDAFAQSTLETDSEKLGSTIAVAAASVFIGRYLCRSLTLAAACLLATELAVWLFIWMFQGYYSWLGIFKCLSWLEITTWNVVLAYIPGAAAGQMWMRWSFRKPPSGELDNTVCAGHTR